MTVTNASRILITRLSHLGDCVLTLPLASALRKHAPQAKIAWIIERPGEQLLANHDAIDELVVVRSGWLKQPRQILAVRKQLRAFAPDICVDPQSLSKSAIPGWLSGARRRIGFAKPVGREIAPQLNNLCVTPASEHLVDRTLELLLPLGIELPSQPDFALPRFSDAANQLGPFLNSHHLGCDFAVINPGAGWASRRWPPRRFATVARHLGQKHQIPSVVVWSGEAEKRMATEIVERGGGHGIMAPATSLTQLTELLRIGAFYVGGDTGPMHFAAAVGTPCVSLYGPTLPARSGAYGEGHEHVQAFYQSRDRKAGDEAMRAIEPDTVIAACERIVQHIRIRKTAA